MQLDSRLDIPTRELQPPGTAEANALAAEAIEWAEATELAPRFSPARGIFNALVIGAGLWTLIFASLALAHAALSG